MLNQRPCRNKVGYSWYTNWDCSHNNLSHAVPVFLAISGGDKAQIGKLKAAIEDGFKQAKEALGGYLPEISQKTYDEVMKRMDEWANE